MLSAADFKCLGSGKLVAASHAPQQKRSVTARLKWSSAADAVSRRSGESPPGKKLFVPSKGVSPSRTDAPKSPRYLVPECHDECTRRDRSRRRTIRVSAWQGGQESTVSTEKPGLSIRKKSILTCSIHEDVGGLDITVAIPLVVHELQRRIHLHPRFQYKLSRMRHRDQRQCAGILGHDQHTLQRYRVACVACMAARRTSNRSACF